MMVAFFLGIVLAYFLFKKNFDQTQAMIFLDYSPYAIFVSVFGARLFYVFGEFDFYCEFPQEIIMINHGGLSLFGAIIFGLICVYVLSRIKKFPFLSHLDTLAVVFPLCQSIGRFGNYFNQEAFGYPVSNNPIMLFVDEKFRPNNTYDKEFYHPCFLYESVLDFILFLILFILFFKFKNLKSGTISCLYLIFYSVIRFFIEGLRVDSILNFGQIPVVRIICIIIFLSALISLIFIQKKK